ncbi:MAG: DegT/DnrJ/EryC1/StrS family aminotransferase [Candidatus Micrarchaeota archaeon]
MGKINFVDLKKQYESIKPEIDAGIARVIGNTSFILGSDVEEFEKEFAAFCGAKHAIGVASGSDALILGLKALGVGSGDEVISVPNTFIATLDGIANNGAKPVLVDVEEDTQDMDVPKVEGAITSKTKAILPVHLFGQSVDMGPLMEIAEKHGIPVVEDACQAHGARYKRKRVGTFGKLSCFSFYPGKNLGAYGDGGAVVTNDDAIAEKIKLLRNYGQKVKYYHTLVGHNSRLDSLQAAILRAKLKHLDSWNKKRNEHAKKYNELLSGVKGIITPVEKEYAEHVFHLYVIRNKKRDALGEFLKKKEIFTGIHYPVPLHMQEAYKYLGYKEGAFPVAEKCAREILSLPMFAELNDEEIERVVDGVKEFVKSL